MRRLADIQCIFKDGPDIFPRMDQNEVMPSKERKEKRNLKRKKSKIFLLLDPLKFPSFKRISVFTTAYLTRKHLQSVLAIKIDQKTLLQRNILLQQNPFVVNLLIGQQPKISPVHKKSNHLYCYSKTRLYDIYFITGQNK